MTLHSRLRRLEGAVRPSPATDGRDEPLQLQDSWVWAELLARGRVSTEVRDGREVVLLPDGTCVDDLPRDVLNAQEVSDAFRRLTCDFVAIYANGPGAWLPELTT